MKIYTKTGDDGNTGTPGKRRVPKDSRRIEAYGAVDETNAALGVVLAHLPVRRPSGGDPALAERDPKRSPDHRHAPGHATLGFQEARRPSVRPHPALEDQIDQMEADLKPLTNFILPQGTPGAAFAHLARAICRRAERRVVALAHDERVDKAVMTYLNRLSDFLFVLARWINAHEGGPETAWSYSEAEGAKTTSEACPGRRTAWGRH